MKSPIRRKVLLSSMLPMGAAIIGMTVLSASNLVLANRRIAEETMRTIGYDVSRSATLFLDEASHSIDTGSAFIVRMVREGVEVDRDSIDGALGPIAESTAGIKNLSYLHDDGWKQFETTSGGTYSTTKLGEERSGYTYAVQEDRVILEDPRFKNTAFMMTYVKPVHVDGSVIGSLGATMTTRPIDQVLEQVLGGHPEMNLALVNANGIIVASPTMPDYLGGPLEPRLPDGGIDLQRIAEGMEDILYQPDTVDLFFPVEIPETDSWSVFVSMPRSLIMADVKAQGLKMVIIGAFFIAVAALLQYVLSTRMIRPLRNLALHMRDIAEGDADLSRDIPVKTDDEVGDVAAAFNRFTGNLSDLVEDLRTSGYRGDALREPLADILKESGQAAESMIQTVVSVDGQSDVLENTVENARTAVVQISSTTGILVDHIENQAAALEEATAAIEEMIASVRNVDRISSEKAVSSKELIEAIDGMSGELKSNSQRITDISKGIDNVNKAAEVINSVASKTNLLAMNAAIEAAHAGQAGRGFAVVADEIRKLAEATTASSKSIGAVLGATVDDIIGLTESTSKTGSSVDKVLEETKAVAESLASISASMTEMSAGTRETMDTLGSLGDITVSVRSAAKELLAGTGVIGESTDTVRSVAGQVSRGADEAGREIAILKTGLERQNEMVASLVDSLGGVVDLLSRFRTRTDAA